MAMTDMNEFRRLKLIWQAEKSALANAEAEIDALFEDWIDGRGNRPTKEMLEQLCEYRHNEYEARGAVDLYISENI